jgi:hypothetical protein
MAFFSKALGAGMDATLSSKFGGLNTDTAITHVKKLLEKSGGAMIQCATFFGLLPKEEEAIKDLRTEANRLGIFESCAALVNNPAYFATAWKEINQSDWEEFCVTADPLLTLPPYQDVSDAVAADKNFARSFQAVAEATFPQLYLLRCIALGITATNEGWMDRLKINTFRTFILRLALPGGEYDKYVDLYVIATSSKDAWDEMRSGQNGRFGFLVESAANLTSTKVGGYFEKKFEKLLGDKFKELTGAI